MEKVNVTIQYLRENVDSLIWRRPLLLTSVGSLGKPNIMPVGGTGIGANPYPYVCEFIQPRWHTAKLIEETGDFTLNVPSEDMDDIVDYCGSVSGRDTDKFKEMNLTPVKSREVKSPIIGECFAHLECRVTGIFDPRLHSISGAGKKYYESHNIAQEYYHRYYMAEIVAIYADEDAIGSL